MTVADGVPRFCLAPRGSKARRQEFRRAKRRETRAALAAVDDETGWYCAHGCGRLVEEGEPGGICRSCRSYAEDYGAMMLAEYECELRAE